MNKKRKRIGCALGMLIMAIIMSGCAGNEESNDQVEAVFEKIDEIPQETGNTDNMPEVGIDEQKDTDTSEAMTEVVVSSLTEYLQNGDTEFLEDGEAYIGTPAINRYEEFLGDRNNWPDNTYDSIHIALGHIDDDDIPELFVCLGTISVYGVHIYKYDPDSDSVIYLGEFSQFGFCRYVERENRIWGQYGNHGYYEFYYFEKVGNKVQVAGRILSDGVFEVIKCYADYADETDITTPVTHLEPSDRPEDSFLISEDEFDRRDEEYMKHKEPIKIGYDNMTKFVLSE